MREHNNTDDWTEQEQPEPRSLRKIKETKLSYSSQSLNKGSARSALSYAAGVAFMSRETYRLVNLECQRRIKSIQLTFRLQMLPTLSFSLTSGVEEGPSATSASPLSSLSPRSLAR